MKFRAKLQYLVRYGFLSNLKNKQVCPVTVTKFHNKLKKEGKCKFVVLILTINAQISAYKNS